MAIFNPRGPFFKHWAVFIDTDNDEDKIIFHAMGGQNNFRFESRNSDARESKSLSEMVELCRLNAEQVERTKEIAESVTIRNDVDVWNCQDYVIDLPRLLENEGIAPRDKRIYSKKKRELLRKIDGLVEV